MNRTRVMAWVGSLVFAVLMGGCGGNNSSSATIGGSVNGLAAGTSVTLELNGSSPITMSADGSFTFSGNLASSDGYNVTVSSQPTGQTCVVTYGSGTIDYAGDSVNDVTVTCTNNVSIGVAVSGLASGNSAIFNLTVQNDPELQSSNSVTSFNITVNADGTDEFPVLLPLGTVYDVTVTTQPGESATANPLQVCTVSGSNPGGVVSLTAIVVNFTCSN